MGEEFHESSTEENFSSSSSNTNLSINPQGGIGPHGALPLTYFLLPVHLQGGMRPHWPLPSP